MKHLTIGRPILHFIFFAMISSHCGVEVGNPGDDEAEAVMTLELADAPIDDAAKVFLDIQGISLITEDDDLYPLTLSDEVTGPVDVLSLQDGLTKVLVEQSIPVADYSGYTITLNEEKIGWVVDANGAEKTLVLPTDGQSYIEIRDSITITESAQVILHLDLQQSLKESEQDGYVTLDPLILPIRRGKFGILQGSVSVTQPALVCAYQEKGETGLQLAPGRPQIAPTVDNKLMRKPPAPQGGFKKLPEKGKRQLARGPKREGKPAKDAQALPCLKGFGSAKVKADGQFSIHFLEPGSYSVRVYSKTDGILDASGTFSVTKSETNDVGALTLSVD